MPQHAFMDYSHNHETNLLHTTSHKGNKSKERLTNQHITVQLQAWQIDGRLEVANTNRLPSTWRRLSVREKALISKDKQCAPQSCKCLFSHLTLEGSARKNRSNKKQPITKVFKLGNKIDDWGKQDVLTLKQSAAETLQHPLSCDGDKEDKVWGKSPAFRAVAGGTAPKTTKKGRRAEIDNFSKTDNQDTRRQRRAKRGPQSSVETSNQEHCSQLNHDFQLLRILRITYWIMSIVDLESFLTKN